MYNLQEQVNQNFLHLDIAETKLNQSVGSLDGITVKQLSMLAQEVYYPYNSFYMPSDWKIHNFETSNVGSFTGGFFRKIVDERTVAWAIAFRGTVPSNAINLIEDLQLSLEKMPSVILVAEEYVTRQIKNIKKSPDKGLAQSFEIVPLYIVGHSLGATVASSIFAFTSIGNNQLGRIQCATFDNPGSLQIVKKYLERNLGGDDFSQEIMNGLVPWSYNIQSDVNWINTCNEQWGNVYRMMRWNFALPGMFGPSTSINKNWLFNYHYAIKYTYDQHKIESIARSIKDDIPINIDQRNIYGFESGYNAYLDPDIRKEYWTEYCKYCWDNNIDFIHEKHLTLEKFTNKMFADLRIMHNT